MLSPWAMNAKYDENLISGLTTENLFLKRKIGNKMVSRMRRLGTFQAVGNNKRLNLRGCFGG